MDLNEAIRNGDIDTAKRLIEEAGYYLLRDIDTIRSIEEGGYELSDFIERINPDTHEIEHFTPAHEAAKAGNIEILELIKSMVGQLIIFLVEIN